VITISPVEVDKVKNIKQGSLSISMISPRADHMSSECVACVTELT